jgi:2-polyprenyl-6-methoxyphenol hydroxylase-like FAD-dependent oxidoreductase
MADVLNVRCCIAGGGPAGMMLGLLLARAGVQVLVLEKHADFLRDFRGDTVHPSTLEVMHELGLLEKFLARPHDEVSELRAVVGGTELVLASFKRLRIRCKFIAMMPQWEFLDFVRDEAELYPGFHLIQNAEVTGVSEEAGTVTGVQVTTPDGPLQVRADLVIGADGRRSTVRSAAGLVVRDLGAPIDVLWMRLPKLPGDPSTTGGRITTGIFLAMIDRGTYWQCAYVIPKGGIEAGARARAAGLQGRHGESGAAVRGPHGRTGGLGRRQAAERDGGPAGALVQARPAVHRRCGPCHVAGGRRRHQPGGAGCGGGGQHALAAPLADARVGTAALTPFLAQVQKRRLLPTRLTQAAQVAIQNRLLSPVLAAGAATPLPMALPWPLKLMRRWPLLQALPAYAVGVGVRPEHVRSPVRHHTKIAPGCGLGSLLLSI